jgi:hypothetical protein
MTDILTRLAQRLAAPQQALRPAPVSRFEPDAFDGPAPLEEIGEERVAHQSPSSPIQADTRMDDLRPPTASPPVPLAETNSHLVPPRDAVAPSPTPAPTTPKAPAEGTIDEAAGRSYREKSPDGTEQGITTERIEGHKVDQNRQRELQVETRTVETRIVERNAEPSRHPSSAETSKPAPDVTASPQAPAPVHHDNAQGSLLRPVARRAADPKPTPAPDARDRDWVTKEEPAPPAPVQVRIDRLEVRVSPPRAVAAAPKPAQPKTVDLDRFLADLEGRS